MCPRVVSPVTRLVRDLAVTVTFKAFDSVVGTDPQWLLEKP